MDKNPVSPAASFPPEPPNLRTPFLHGTLRGEGDSEISKPRDNTGRQEISKGTRGTNPPQFVLSIPSE